MEKKIKELVREIIPEQEVCSADLDILTQEELIACVKKAISTKEGMIAEVAHWEKVNHPLIPPKELDWLDPFFKNMYKTQNGADFIEDEYTTPIIKVVTDHLLSDRLPKEKGIYIYGRIGAGKSSILKAMATNPFAPMRFVSCRKIAEQYSATGIEGIQRYMTGNWIFDELGREEIAVSYGNRTEVMVSVLMSHYESRNFRNYITTNLNKTAIVSRYGDYIWSRFNEMFEMVDFHKDSPDRRLQTKI